MYTLGPHLLVFVVDIKPDNILLSDPHTPGSVDDSGLWDPYLATFKLIDLGHGKGLERADTPGGC